MSFDENIESSGRAKTPGEELEMLQRRLQDRQERLGIVDPAQSERERIASQEVLAYGKEKTNEVIDPSLQMDIKESNAFVEALSFKGEIQVDELVEILVEKGVKNTLEVVNKINDPHLSDDFHRFLIQYLSEGMTVRGLKEGSPLFKALHMTLFEVTLPDIVDIDQGFSQLVMAMEQFYSGMLSIRESSRLKSYFTLEIAQSNAGNSVVFYISVPNTKIALFEKQLMATFPSAQISEHKQDYNPFNEKGFSAGSIAKLTKPAALPLKTFESFEQDPLNVILGAFSKMKQQGEGAAVQLVVAPVKDEINKKYQEVLKEVKKGISLNRALEGATMRVTREIAGIAKEAFFGPNKKEKEEGTDDIDQGEIDAVTEKISSPIVNANIRIVGSAATQVRAEEIVSDLEASFNQFTNEPFNSVGFRKVNKKGLQSLLHDFSFRLYSEKYAMRLNLKEMTSMFHLPVMNVTSAELKQSDLISAPAPADMHPEGLFLGINRHRGEEKNIYFTQEDRMRHFYMIGQTGTGKTTLLKNMIMQDINNGEGVCYIDPHGTDIEDVLNSIPEHRKEDVIYFDPSDSQWPIGLNMLEYDISHPEQKSFVINEMLSIFNKLFDMKTAGGPMFEQYFRNATALVIEDPQSGNTLIDVARVLADPKFRELKLSKCNNPIVVQFWKEIAAKAGGEASLANMIPYITNKFDAFLSNDVLRSIVVQERSSFNFRDIMDNRKILLVNLAKGKLGDINANLIGLILVGKIFMAALSRVDILDRKPADFYLYIDEFQNVTTDSVSAILSEARKYRLGLIIAHQFIAQLDEGIRDAVFGNVGSLAVFRVGAEDAQFVESQFAPVFSAADIMKTPNQNAYVKMLVNGSVTKPFNMQTVAPISGDTGVGSQIKEFSRKTYGREKAQVDEIVAKKYAKLSTSFVQSKVVQKKQVVSNTASQIQPAVSTVDKPIQHDLQKTIQTPVVSQEDTVLNEEKEKPENMYASERKKPSIANVLEDVQTSRPRVAVITDPFADHDQRSQEAKVMDEKSAGETVGTPQYGFSEDEKNKNDNKEKPIPFEETGPTSEKDEKDPIAKILEAEIPKQKSSSLITPVSQMSDIPENGISVSVEKEDPQSTESVDPYRESV